MDICFSNLNLRDDAGMFWVDTAAPPALNLTDRCDRKLC